MRTTASTPGRRLRADAAKERVDGGPAMILGRVLVEVKGGRCAGAGGGQDFHVPVAAGDVDGSGSDRLAFGRPRRREAAAPIEPLGKEPGEDFRHVLHDEDRQRKVSAGSAGSRTSSAAGPPVETPMATHAWAKPREVELDAGSGSARPSRKPAAQAWPQRAVAGASDEGVNFGKQLLSQSAYRRFAAGLAGGLGDIIAGAAGKGFDGDFGAALGERTAHDDRHLVALCAQIAQRDQAIHDRHLDIEQDQVGMDEIRGRSSAVAPSAAVPATSRPASAADDRAQQAAHDGGVVDDQDPGSADGRHRSGLHQAEHGQLFLSASSSKGFIRYSSAPASRARRISRSPLRWSPSSLSGRCIRRRATGAASPGRS